MQTTKNDPSNFTPEQDEHPFFCAWDPAHDDVNHPSHYLSGGIEVIDVIEAYDLDYLLGNVVKYVLRAGRKGDRLTDLKKARWYIDRAIANEEAAIPKAIQRCSSCTRWIEARDGTVSCKCDKPRIYEG